MTRVRIRSILMAAVLISLWAVSATTSVAAEFVNVVSEGVNLRSGPSTNSDILYELPDGYPLEVLAREGKWLQVRDFENDRGWIYASLVKQGNEVIVKVKEANVRSGPASSTAKVGSVTREVILKKVDQQGDWIKVEHPVLSGWIYKKLVWP